MKLESSQQISGKYSIVKLMKIIPVAAELFHAFGQTDMTNLTVQFFENAKRLFVFYPHVVFVCLNLMLSPATCVHQMQLSCFSQRR